MKIAFRNLFVLALFILLLNSCKPDDVYVNLSQNAKELIGFEVGQTFRLKDNQTNQIITLTVMSKNIQHYESSEYSTIYLGPRGDYYIERGEYTFTDTTNCYNGIVTVEAVTNDDFKFQIFLSNCFGNSDFPFEFSNEIFPQISFLGNTYNNVYFLPSAASDIYYTKEKGIIKIVNSFNQNVRFSIIE